MIKDSKYTIRENAERLKIPFSTYNNYLIGCREPNLQTLIKLADYFDVSLDYLCGRMWNNNIGYIPEEKKDLVKQLLELDEIDTKKAKAYITALKDSKK